MVPTVQESNRNTVQMNNYGESTHDNVNKIKEQLFLKSKWDGTPSVGFMKEFVKPVLNGMANIAQANATLKDHWEGFDPGGPNGFFQTL